MVYDLGCGDGRILIAAARRFGTHGLGVDINPQRVAQARANARRAGVQHLVEFRQQDLLDTDLHNATVVMLYLFPEINLVLRPKLQHELRPGARVVSNTFDMGDWKADRQIKTHGSSLYLWTIVPQPDYGINAWR
jgi:ribosomal protein L11 methylase PrmA